MSILNAPTHLVDQWLRVIDYIRISITDRCDFRCHYCMAEDMRFLPRNEVLSLDECARLVAIFVRLGVKKVRVTGGEPLVRKNALWLFTKIGQIAGVEELTLTTNGSQLAKYASSLYAAGVRRINISLDSLNPERFHAITRTGSLERVLQGIASAQQAGLHIRLNSVLMRNINDDEISALVNFAIQRGLDIAFIEEMPLGTVDHLRENSFVSNTETLSRLERSYTLIPSTYSTRGPARYWHIAGSNSKLGLISPHSHNFCATCNRVRISCKGELFLCLGQEHKIELMPLLRAYPKDDRPLIQAIIDSMHIKPVAHNFDLTESKPSVVRFMSYTGG